MAGGNEQAAAFEDESFDTTRLRRIKARDICQYDYAIAREIGGPGIDGVEERHIGQVRPLLAASLVGSECKAKVIGLASRTPGCAVAGDHQDFEWIDNADDRISLVVKGNT